MVQASRSTSLRFKDDLQPSDGIVVHGERFVTTDGKDDLGRRLCLFRWCGGAGGNLVT
jgi:hypothetical protein